VIAAGARTCMGRYGNNEARTEEEEKKRRREEF
jgi:hypothetical protein